MYVHIYIYIDIHMHDICQSRVLDLCAVPLIYTLRLSVCVQRDVVPELRLVIPADGRVGACAVSTGGGVAARTVRAGAVGPPAAFGLGGARPHR